MNRIIGQLLLGFTLTSAPYANAGTIVSTFLPGDLYDTCCGIGNVAPTQVAFAFEAPIASDFTFTGAALALSQGIGSVNAVDISLAGDSSGQPGTILESFHLENALGPAGANNPPVVVTSVLNPVLLAGSVYWLIETPSTAGNGVNWQTAHISASPSLQATGDGAGSWTVFDDSFISSWPGAFKILADPVSSTPEPSAFLLLGSGLGMALLLRAIRQVPR